MIHIFSFFFHLLPYSSLCFLPFYINVRRKPVVTYGVPTKVLIQAVKRNPKRFPLDFMFQLTQDELQHLRSQFVTSSWGGRRYAPYVFTEQGVAMLSSVLNSERAIQVNIVIMRTFVRLKEAFASQNEILKKLSDLETRVDRHDKGIAEILEVIRTLVSVEQKPSRKIGFHSE